MFDETDQASFDFDDYIWEEEDTEESDNNPHTDGVVAEAMARLFLKCKGFRCVATESNDVCDLHITFPITHKIKKVQVKSRSERAAQNRQQDNVRLTKQGGIVNGRATRVAYDIGDFDYLVAVIGCHIWVIPASRLEAKGGGTYDRCVHGLKAGNWDRWKHNFHDALDDFQKGEIKRLPFTSED